MIINTGRILIISLVLLKNYNMSIWTSLRWCQFHVNGTIREVECVHHAVHDVVCVCVYAVCLVYHLRTCSVCNSKTVRLCVYKFICILSVHVRLREACVSVYRTLIVLHCMFIYYVRLSFCVCGVCVCLWRLCASLCLSYKSPSWSPLSRVRPGRPLARPRPRWGRGLRQGAEAGSWGRELRQGAEAGSWGREL